MVEALKLAKGKRANIYKDSAYAFGAGDIKSGQWKRAGFLIVGNQSIKHEEEMKEIDEALRQPLEIAIIKCKGHDESGTQVTRGNAEADKAPKI